MVAIKTTKTMNCVFKYLMKYEEDYAKVPLKQREKIKRSKKTIWFSQTRALQLTAQIKTDTTTITHTHLIMDTHACNH